MRLATLAALERVAAVLRRAGLGRVVDRAGGRVLRGIGRVSVEVDGIRLGGLAAHAHYLRDLRDDARERQMAKLFEQSVPAGGLVLDIGAHLGYFTLLAARRGAEVIAFEPNPRTLALLRANLRANGAEARVTIVPAAVAGAPGRRRFHLSAAGDESSLHAGAATAGAVEVDVVVVDAVVGGRAVDAIKIDVEGAELEALAGMERTIAAAAAHLRLFVECYPDALARAGATADELLARLRALGLEPTAIEESTGGYVNLLCVRADG